MMSATPVRGDPRYIVAVVVVFVSTFFSVVCLHEVEGFSVARVRLLHAEPVLILAHSSSESEALVTEEVGSRNETTHNTIGEATSCKEEPIEVVSGPELLEEHSLPHDSLLLGGIKATSINNGKLEPSSGRISMGMRSLVAGKVSS